MACSAPRNGPACSSRRSRARSASRTVRYRYCRKTSTCRTRLGTHGLLSSSEWTGVQFSTIAREVGLKDSSSWVLAEGADAAVMTRSIPIEKMLKDALLVYGQNGEAIRPEQGYPLRLLLPGYEGNA